MEDTRTITRRYNTFQRKEISWIWKPFIARGKISLINGDPSSGKTTLALAIAALLTTGRPMPEDEREPLCGEVIYQSVEDNVGDTLNPRLAAMGANCEKISVIESPFSDIEKDCETLESAIRETGALMCVLDPLQGFIGKGSDMNRAAHMRRLMGGLALVAERTGCAIVVIGHMTKNAGTKSLYRGLGSIDIAAAARSVLSVGRSADDNTVRVITHVKSSLAPEGEPLAFTIGKDSAVEFLGRYDGEISPFDDLPGEDGKRESATAIMLEMLAGGPVRCSEIYAACLSAGIGERTVDTAKKELGVKSVRKGDGWYWAV